MTPRNLIRHLTPLMLLPLALAACDDASGEGFRLPWDKAPAEEVPAHTGPPAVSPLVEPIERADSTPVAVATAEARTLNEAAFAAEGPGGAWRIEVAGNKAVYQRHGARDAALDMRRIPYARGVEYIGVLNGQPFALTITGDKCGTEGMGKGWTMAARLKVAGRMHQGCAAPAAKAPARATPTPAPATTAPATTAPTATAAPDAAAKEAANSQPSGAIIGGILQARADPARRGETRLVISRASG